jgi:hypothetical protein
MSLLDHSSLDHVETYLVDKNLFKKLGFTPFSGITLFEKHFVGEYKSDMGYIKLWVKAYPAMFWEAEIYSKDNGNTFNVVTGSGTLVNYWGHFTAILDGMLVVESK